MKSIVQPVMFYHSPAEDLEGIVSQGSLISAFQKKLEEYLLN
jgi:hypothetical protein